MRKGNIFSTLFLAVIVTVPALAQQRQLSQSSVPQKQDSMKGDGPVESLSISPDGKILVAHFHGRSFWNGRDSVYLGGKMGIWSLPDLKSTQRYDYSGEEYVMSATASRIYYSSGIAITPDSTTLILGGGWKEKILGKSKWIIPVLSLPDGQLLTELEKETKRESPIWGSGTLVVTPDGNYLAIGYSQQKRWQVPGYVDLWSLRDKKLLTTLEGHSNEINALAITPDGKTLVSASRDKTIKFWSLPDGKLLSTLQGHTKPVNTLAITPDGKILASGSDDKTIKLWSLADGKLISSLEGHAKGMNSLAIAPDGRMLFSGSADRTIKVWTLPDGKLLTTLQEHTKSVKALAIASDGKLLVSGDDEGLIIIWALTGESTS